MLPIEKEIAEKVKKYEERIFEVFVPDSFTLNTEIVELQSKIYALQEECPHGSIVKGICAYCGKEFK